MYKMQEYYKKGTVNVVYGGCLKEGVLEPVIPRQTLGIKRSFPSAQGGVGHSGLRKGIGQRRRPGTAT